MVRINRKEIQTRESILEHLRKYKKYYECNGRFDVYPYSLTVPGISKDTGLTRAPIRNNLRYLMVEGIVERRHGRVNGLRRKVEIYLMKPSNYK